MLLLVLFVVGLAVSLGFALLVRGSRGRLAIGLAGFLLWAGYTIYIETIASCPTRGECDKQTGVLFVGTVLAGWLVGITASWAIRRPAG